MRDARPFIVIAAAGVFMLGMYALAFTMPTRQPPVPTDARTAGVEQCGPDSVRIVRVPAGAKTAFSCPTHIEVTSFDEHTDTLLAFRRPPR